MLGSFQNNHDEVKVGHGMKMGIKITTSMDLHERGIVT